MSASSISSAGSEHIAARLRVMAPAGRWKVFDHRTPDIAGLDAFCVVSNSAPADFPGFALRLRKKHRVPERLGDAVARLLREKGLPRWLGALCRPESAVGARVCRSTVPGVNEFFYQRAGLAAADGSEAKNFPRDMICSVAGCGHLPLVGATAASFAVCAVALATQSAVPPEAWKFTMLLLAAAFSVPCFLLEAWARRHYLADDPREVVLDEAAGMLLALAVAGPGLWNIAAAFFFFRLFDVFKPGIQWVEKRGWRGTVLWDDLLAGLYAGGAVILSSSAYRLCREA